MGFFQRLFAGNTKTKKSFGEKLKYIFTGSEIDQDFYDELEFALLSSDIGAKTTDEILEKLKQQIKEKKLKKTDESKELLKQIMIDMLTRVEPSQLTYPLIIMVVGVNGVGKTTAIGKMANLFNKEGKSVLIAAGDTFRAAASDQLEIWAERAKVRIVKSSEGADPASVVFDAISSAKAKKTDVLIIDTAGRLHNKANLMEELKKINRVVEREAPNFNYHKAIVVDATTGQNAINQVELFNDAVNLTDVIITKLDGTAKGGFLLNLPTEFDLPIRFVGVGESVDDLLPFNAKDFVDSII